MKCKTCQYPLWNIRDRVCPECGSAFKPSDFEFVPSSVRFCCPSCEQPYYGTDANGHLVPRSFGCVRCGDPVEMDETVLLPTEGVDERRTQQDGLAWERRELGVWKRFWPTCGQAMVAPHRMGSILAQHGEAGPSTRFTLLTHALALFGSFVPMLLMMAFGVAMGAAITGGLGVAEILTMLAVGLGSYLGALVVSLAALLLWALGTHAILMIGGNTGRGFGRTWTALCYASGANVVTALPCLGLYIGPLWWLVASVFTIRGAHGVGGLRASLAALVPPVTMTLLVFGAYIGGVLLLALNAPGGAFGGVNAPAMRWGQPAYYVADAMDSWPDGTAAVRGRTDETGLAGQQSFPEHGLYLLIDGLVEPGNYAIERPSGGAAVDPGGLAVGRAGWSIGGLPLDDFAEQAPQVQIDVVSAAVEAWPDDVVAHRVGDVVFCAHGVSPLGNWRGPANDMDLWIAVYWPYTGVDATGARLESELDPDRVIVLKQGGAWMSEAIDAAGFDEALADQNDLRATYGLGALPHPALVRDVSGPAPASADETSAETEAETEEEAGESGATGGSGG